MAPVLSYGFMIEPRWVVVTQLQKQVGLKAFTPWGVWAKVECCCADMGFISLGRLPLVASLVAWPHKPPNQKH
jgi:hypothetical protein